MPSDGDLLEARGSRPRATNTRLPPLGFWSYSRRDDELSLGRLSSLRSLLMQELQQQYGRDSIRLFQDLTTIPHGSAWEREIRRAIDQSTFLIAIITPNFVQSEWCSREIRLFLEREKQLASRYPELPDRGRIFPILFIDVEDVEPDDVVAFSALKDLQWFDFRRFRHRSYEEAAVREAVSELASSIRDLLKLRVAPAPEPSLPVGRLQQVEEDAKAAGPETAAQIPSSAEAEPEAVSDSSPEPTHVPAGPEPEAEGVADPPRDEVSASAATEPEGAVPLEPRETSLSPLLEPQQAPAAESPTQPPSPAPVQPGPEGEKTAPPAPGEIGKERSAAEVSARPIEIGDLLNHIFEVKRFIKAGGIGQVFEGCNAITGERVAIKALLPALASDPKVIAMFQREAITLTRLHHEALVQYRVLAREPQLGVLYIVTEYIEGVDLSEALGRVDRSSASLRRLLGRLASGLGAAHRLGAIHRDISPDNVMLPEGDLDQAKIIDFGIAKDLGGALPTIIGKGFAGKLSFVAPEQFGDYSGEIGTWTDVYSLGLLILSVAKGEKVDMAGSVSDAIRKRRQGPDLSAAPEDLRPLLADMLRPDPAERLPTMEAVLERLEAPPARRRRLAKKRAEATPAPAAPEIEETTGLIASFEAGPEPTVIAIDAAPPWEPEPAFADDEDGVASRPWYARAPAFGIVAAGLVLIAFFVWLNRTPPAPVEPVPSGTATAAAESVTAPVAAEPSWLFDRHWGIIDSENRTAPCQDPWRFSRRGNRILAVRIHAAPRARPETETILGAMSEREIRTDENLYQRNGQNVRVTLRTHPNAPYEMMPCV
jgi:hypothetical protein